MLEETNLNVSLGIDIWKEHIFSRKKSEYICVFKLHYDQFIHVGPHAAELQIILDINFVGT